MDFSWASHDKQFWKRGVDADANLGRDQTKMLEDAQF